MMTTKELSLLNTMHVSSAELDMALQAMNELINDYDWNITPNASKAIKYGTSIGAEKENCSFEYKMSWKWITEYKRIIWLMKVARDYCYNALQILEETENNSEMETSNKVAV